MLVLCRFFQGLVSGPLIPLSQSLLVEVNPPEKKNKVLAFFSAVVLIGPILGPVLGGWIAFDYSWPWIFYINIPIGLISAFLIWALLKGKSSSIERKPMDWLGFFLLLVGMASLQIILDKGEQFDWFRSGIIQTLGATCLISFAFFVAWELKKENPFVDLRLMKVGSFITSLVSFLFFYGLYFGSIVLVPLWLQTQMGYTTTWAGLAVAPFGIVPFTCSIFMGRIISRYGSLRPMIFGVICFVLSSFYPIQFDTNIDFFHVALSRFFFGIGVTLFVTPAFALSIQDISTPKLPSATGLFHFVRAMVGGFGTSIFTTLWDRRTIYHHQVLGEHTTAFSEQTQEMLSDLGQLGLQDKSGLAALNVIVDQQSSMLALNDCFYLMGWIFIALIPILSFFYFYQRRGKKFLPQI
jgi:DHA2 family multidrug resistance protein